MLVAGGGCLLIADQWSWHAAYAAMAALVGVGVVATLLIAEPQASATAPAEDLFVTAVVDPFRDFMRRPGWLLILVFVALYRYSDALLGNMANPFYLELGFTKTQIGLVSKGYGAAMTFLGTFCGGLLFGRLGFARSLMIAGIAQTASNLFFVVLALKGPSIAFLAAHHQHRELRQRFRHRGLRGLPVVALQHRLHRHPIRAAFRGRGLGPHHLLGGRRLAGRPRRAGRPSSPSPPWPACPA